jgi:hypothetical protein
MKPLSVIGYAVFVVALLFAVFSIGGDASEQSTTMAPDLHNRQ